MSRRRWGRRDNMKLQAPGPFRFNSDMLLRRCGYGRIVNRTGDVSFVRVMGRSGYPRFHAYVEGDPVTEIRVNLHLDQKQPSYGEQTAHSGEYEGPVVETEGQRILVCLIGLKR